MKQFVLSKAKWFRGKRTVCGMPTYDDIHFKGVDPNNVCAWLHFGRFIYDEVGQLVAEQTFNKKFSRVSAQAIEINDNPNITDDERIEQLTAIFAEIGYELVVED